MKSIIELSLLVHLYYMAQSRNSAFLGSSVFCFPALVFKVMPEQEWQFSAEEPVWKMDFKEEIRP